MIKRLSVPCREDQIYWSNIKIVVCFFGRPQAAQGSGQSTANPRCAALAVGFPLLPLTRQSSRKTISKPVNFMFEGCVRDKNENPFT